MSEPLESLFPGLRRGGYEITSPADPGYNCVAWAAQDVSRWWEPDPWGLRHWPAGVRREYTQQAYAEAFRRLGFVDCDDAGFEEGWEKVAIFSTDEGTPTHAARQLPDGTWTSKLGSREDIKHPGLEQVSGEHYGKPAIVLRRRRASATEEANP